MKLVVWSRAEACELLIPEKEDMRKVQQHSVFVCSSLQPGLPNPFFCFRVQSEAMGVKMMELPPVERKPFNSSVAYARVSNLSTIDSLDQIPIRWAVLHTPRYLAASLACVHQTLIVPPSML